MTLNDAQRSLTTRIVNVFETGKPEGDYGAVSVFDDGPGRVPQITYGRSQTTEYGNLPELLKNYIDSNGIHAAEMSAYLPQLCSGVLVKDAVFKRLLKQAGSDPVMIRVQDSFFDEKYFQPAQKWADKNGFVLPLSMLVIYDSFIHSGSVRDFLRARFPEVPPVKGGPEKSWTSAYVHVRHAWLATHSNAALHPTVYRTACFKEQMDKDNWDLDKVPVMANGHPVLPA